MNAPFLLFDDGDICLFRTIEALASYVESPDTTRYLATDSKGRIVRLTPTTSPRRSNVGIVSVQPVTATPTTELVEQGQLCESLRLFLYKTAVEFDDGAGMDELIRQLECRIGYTD
jgi:hypothetical protein